MRPARPWRRRPFSRTMAARVCQPSSVPILAALLATTRWLRRWPACTPSHRPVKPPMEMARRSSRARPAGRRAAQITSPPNCSNVVRARRHHAATMAARVVAQHRGGGWPGARPAASHISRVVPRELESTSTGAPSGPSMATRKAPAGVCNKVVDVGTTWAPGVRRVRG